MKTLKVEENAGTYTVTMSPNNCSYEIPLLGLANAQVRMSCKIISWYLKWDTENLT